jgi:2-methylisocitrate lyase-like PEP mutase family enzyme
VLYAPGLASGEQIAAVCEATELPLNVLAFRGLSMEEIAEAGAQRVSVGSGLAWTAFESMAAAAEAMRDEGDFSGLLGPKRIRGWLGT